VSVYYGQYELCLLLRSIGIMFFYYSNYLLMSVYYGKCELYQVYYGQCQVFWLAIKDVIVYSLLGGAAGDIFTLFSCFIDILWLSCTLYFVHLAGISAFGLFGVVFRGYHPLLVI